MSASEERNKRLLEFAAHTDDQAFGDSADIRSVVEENQRLREALEMLVNHPGPCSERHKGCAVGRAALAGEASK